MVEYEEGYPYGVPKEFLERTLRNYKEGKFSFKKLCKELREATGFIEDILMDNLALFKGKVKSYVLARAVLDGALLYSRQTTKKYLESGLSRRVLINWLRRHLRYEYFVDEGAEDEEIIYDYEILELCQLLRENHFSVEEVESVLDSLKEDAKVFFLMVTEQYSEYLDVSIDPAKYLNRAVKYPYFTEKIRFEEIIEILPVPYEFEKKLVRKVFKLYPLKEIIGYFFDGEDAMEYLASCGVRTDVIARKYVAEIGYDNISEDEALFGHFLSVRVLTKAVGLGILDHSRIEENWEKYYPFASSYDFSDSTEEDESDGGSNVSDHVGDTINDDSPQPCCYSRICRDSGYDDEEYMDLMAIF